MKRLYIAAFLMVLVFPIYAQTYEDMVVKAMDLIEQEDYLAAEQAMKAALRKEPANQNNPMLMVNLGTIQRNLGKLNEALLSYNVAIEKYPDNSFIRHNRASLYCEMDKFDDAIKDYNTILLSDPHDIEALYRRGLIYLSNKDLFSAEEDFEKILEINGDNLKGKMGLASIMKRRSEWKEAEEVYSYLIYKNSNYADLYFNRAECYIELNRLGKAQDDVKKALELGFEAPSIYVLRGKIRMAQYEKQLAKEDFLKAKELGVNGDYIDELISSCK